MNILYQNIRKDISTLWTMIYKLNIESIKSIKESATREFSAFLTLGNRNKNSLKTGEI